MHMHTLPWTVDGHAEIFHELPVLREIPFHNEKGALEKMSFARKTRRKMQKAEQEKDKKLERLLFCPKCGGVLDYDVLECKEKALQVMRCDRCGYCAETDRDPYESGEAYEQLKEELENRPTGDCETCKKDGSCKGKVWPCDPNKATTCAKRSCFLNGGPCRSTHNPEHAEEGSAPYCMRLHPAEPEKGRKT